MKAILVLSFLSVVGISPAQTVTEPKAVPTTPKVLTRTLIDRDELRSVEVVTTRHESLAQFFGRQPVILSSMLKVEGKPVPDWTQFQITKPTSLFVSYPLYSDDAFGLKYFGANVELIPPSSAVLDVLKNAWSSSWSDRLLILVFDDGLPTSAAQRKGKPRVRIVGCIQDNGQWRPGDEKELFAISSPVR